MTTQFALLSKTEVECLREQLVHYIKETSNDLREKLLSKRNPGLQSTVAATTALSNALDNVEDLMATRENLTKFRHELESNPKILGIWHYVKSILSLTEDFYSQLEQKERQSGSALKLVQVKALLGIRHTAEYYLEYFSDDDYEDGEDESMEDGRTKEEYTEKREKKDLV